MKAIPQSEQKNEENKNVFEEIASQIQSINPALGGFEELAVMLELPEDQFGLLGGVYLDSLQKSFNNVGDKLVLVQTLNAAGIKVQDIQNTYLKIIAEIDEQFAKQLSRQKRDFLKQMLGITFNAIADTEGVTKKVIEIPLEKCHPKAKIPTYANVGDAGLDLYALEDITIHPGETKLIHTGIKIAIPYGYEMQVRPKSGRALKTKFRVANTPGTIDSTYRGEICVIIDNIEPPIKDITYELSDEGKIEITSILHGSDFTIGEGEKFAQIVLCDNPKASFYEVETIGELQTTRGEGGFGSTGLN